MALKGVAHQVRTISGNYFRNTTIHGFRYISETTNPLLKLVWVLSVSAAFALCLSMILANLKEAQLNPTMTITEEVGLDSFPIPAISILAPRQTRSFYSGIRVANSINACDPNVDISKSELLSPFLMVTKTINDQVRSKYVPTAAEIIQYQNLLENDPVKPLYERFCTTVSQMDINERQAFMLELNNRIDSLMLVHNVSSVLEDYIPHNLPILPTCQHDLSGPDLLDEGMVQEWMELIAPIAFKDTQRLVCKARYRSVFQHFVTIIHSFMSQAIPRFWSHVQSICSLQQKA